MAELGSGKINVPFLTTGLGINNKYTNLKWIQVFSWSKKSISNIIYTSSYIMYERYKFSYMVQ
jgi:hypothetical protein